MMIGTAWAATAVGILMVLMAAGAFRLGYRHGREEAEYQSCGCLSDFQDRP